MVDKCMLNCPSRLRKSEGWKIDERGRTAESLSNGFERETDIKEIEPRIPMAVI
jgi:hypothetical protein